MIRSILIFRKQPILRFRETSTRHARQIGVRNDRPFIGPTTCQLAQAIKPLVTSVGQWKILNLERALKCKIRKILLAGLR